MSGDSWIGHYHVVTSDVPELWEHPDYHEFNQALWLDHQWISLRTEVNKGDEAYDSSPN